MARAIKQGQHIFIAFQDGEAVLDRVVGGAVRYV